MPLLRTRGEGGDGGRRQQRRCSKTQLRWGKGRTAPEAAQGASSAPGTPVEVLHCTEKLPLQVSQGLLDSSPSHQGFPSSLQEWGLAGWEASAQRSEIVSVDNCQCSAIGTL